MLYIAHLRRAGEEAHERLEATPFARTLIEGRVERQRYCDYLRSIAIIVDTLRVQVQLHGTASQRVAFADAPTWTELLAADLAALGPDSPSTYVAAHAAALTFADEIHRRVADGTAFLLGVAYVLVGSHRGNRSIATKVRTALGLDGDDGIRYLRATRGQGDGPWQAFLAFLERELRAPAASNEAIEGMHAAFAAFETIHAALYDETARTLHVGVLNPDAGNHPIAQDPEIVSLAIRVADQATTKFPYLSFRYGLRGYRFARSDSAWLTTLIDFEMRAAQRQITWLVGVLAARGIPSIVLQTHLVQLGEALDGARGEGAGTRLQQLADHIAQHHDAELLSRYAELRIDVPELGEEAAILLACAAIDQHAGVGACANNIRAWASSEPRLSEAGKRAITAVLDHVTQTLASDSS